MASPGQTSGAPAAPTASPVTPRRRAARVSVSYALLAAAWIVVTDLFMLYRAHDPGVDTHAFESIVKGLAFVAVTAGLLQLFIERSIARALQAEHGSFERSFDLLMLDANDAIFLVDEGGRIVKANKRAFERYGYREEQLIGMPVAMLRTPGERERLPPVLELALGASHAMYETVHQTRDGRAFPVETSSRVVEVGGRRLVQGIVRDISERKGAARALAESEVRFRAMVEQSISGIYVIQDDRFAYVNPRFAQIFGYGSPAEVIGRNPADLVGPRDRAMVAANLRRRLTGEIHSLAYTFAGLRKDGGEVEVGVHGSLATFAGRPAVIGALQDISERARIERERERALEELNATATRLAKVNRALRTLSAGNETLVRSTDEPQLLREMCRVIVQSGGYRFASVGYVQPGAGRPIAPQASAGIPFEELRHIPMPRADPGHPLAPSASAIASGAAQLYLDPASDPSLGAWRDLIVRYELASAVSMPLRASKHSTPYGVLVIGAADRDAFDPEAIRLLQELANDLAFGVGILRLREDQRASAAALRKSLEDTILAIAATTEMRDPYTAGHERRVAELAAAIAREMGLAEPAIEGIRFGAMIHDLGKIKIPAEILVKPTRLMPIEYEFIKQHAQAGYDILKGIDFPWPVAQMVLQHHERLDGSGYPNGLKGDAVIREARILAVADVVEAMSSHRPYRPGLGLDTALAEIERGRGTAYDAAVVDACLRLFREKGYTLPA